MRELTERQRDMVAALARGLDTDDICALFQLAERTVQNEMTIILKVLGAANRTQAVAMYLRPLMDVRRPAEPMVDLDRFPTYVIGDQPETCRGCGARTGFLEVGKLQLHACERCKAAFLVEV